MQCRRHVSLARATKHALALTEDVVRRSGLVTFIAAYHYFRIFNSWTEAYAYPAATDGVVADPAITGQPFNDA
jgi:hypothetical protein